MKQYLAFAGYDYYPRGGMNDFVGDFDTHEEAVEAIRSIEAREQHFDMWGHVWDSEALTSFKVRFEDRL